MVMTGRDEEEDGDEVVSHDHLLVIVESHLPRTPPFCTPSLPNIHPRSHPPSCMHSCHAHLPARTPSCPACSPAFTHACLAVHPPALYTHPHPLTPVRTHAHAHHTHPPAYTPSLLPSTDDDMANTLSTPIGNNDSGHHHIPSIVQRPYGTGTSTYHDHRDEGGNGMGMSADHNYDHGKEDGDEGNYEGRARLQSRRRGRGPTTTMSMTNCTTLPPLDLAFPPRHAFDASRKSSPCFFQLLVTCLLISRRVPVSSPTSPQHHSPNVLTSIHPVSSSFFISPVPLSCSTLI